MCSSINKVCSNFRGRGKQFTCFPQCEFLGNHTHTHTHACVMKPHFEAPIPYDGRVILAAAKFSEGHSSFTPHASCCGLSASLFYKEFVLVWSSGFSLKNGGSQGGPCFFIYAVNSTVRHSHDTALYVSLFIRPGQTAICNCIVWR